MEDITLRVGEYPLLYFLEGIEISNIQNNDLVKAIRICSNPDRFSILKVLEKLDEVKYITLRKIIIHADSKDPRFNYHLRILKTNKMVKSDQITGLYKLTEKGRTILDIISKFSVKYIAEESSEICNNSSDDGHKYVLVCRRCAHIKEPMEITA